MEKTRRLLCFSKHLSLSFGLFLWTLSGKYLHICDVALPGRALIQKGKGGLAALNPVIFHAAPMCFSARPCVRPSDTVLPHSAAFRDSPRGSVQPQGEFQGSRSVLHTFAVKSSMSIPYSPLQPHAFREVIPTYKEGLSVTCCGCKGLNLLTCHYPHVRHPCPTHLAGAEMTRVALSCQLQNKQQQSISPCPPVFLCSFLAPSLAVFLPTLLVPPLLSACVSPPLQDSLQPHHLLPHDAIYHSSWCRAAAWSQLEEVTKALFNPPRAVGRHSAFTPSQKLLDAVSYHPVYGLAVKLKRQRAPQTHLYQEQKEG